MMHRCEGVCVSGSACPGEIVCNLVVVSMQVFQGTCVRVWKCLGLGSCVALGWACDCAAAGVTKHVTAWLRSLGFLPVSYLFLLIADMSLWDCIWLYALRAPLFLSLCDCSFLCDRHLCLWTMWCMWTACGPLWYGLS